MQIVIDISDADYEIAKVGSVLFSETSGINYRMFKAIANGTPLPKNHGSLIDVDELVKVTIYNPLHCPYITKEDIDGVSTVIGRRFCT